MFAYLMLFGAVYLIGCLAGGYHLDEQVNHPHNKKHTVLLSRKAKRFFLFKNKSRRHDFLKAAYIEELSGYIGFAAFLLAAGVCRIFDFHPDSMVLIAVTMSVLSVSLASDIAIYLYYRKKYG